MKLTTKIALNIKRRYLLHSNTILIDTVMYTI